MPYIDGTDLKMPLVSLDGCCGGGGWVIKGVCSIISFNGIVKFVIISDKGVDKGFNS